MDVAMSQIDRDVDSGERHFTRINRNLTRMAKIGVSFLFGYFFFRQVKKK